MVRITMSEQPIYIATVCLERNRWGSHQPSFAVSEWLERIEADGFSGIELWAFHYLLAGPEEQARLADLAAPIALFNTYASFADEAQAAQQRADAAAAIAQLGATGVKYNVGRDADRIDEYRRNVIAWADQLPPTCRLLCECHPGTPLETIDQAKAFFDDLAPQRFGIMAHLMDDPAGLEQWVTAFGPRLQHIHIQRRTPEADPTTATGRKTMAACVGVLKAHGFAGSASIEFTRGIGKDEHIESIYTNALADRAAYAENW